jgi:hypothetical protein
MDDTIAARTCLTHLPTIMHISRSETCAILARVWVLSLLLVSGVSTARAQQIEPRAYSNAPVGINFALASYGFADGSVVVDPSVPLENANLQIHATGLAYVRTLGLWGLSTKANVIVPFAWLSGTAEFAGEPVQREVSGFGDLGLRVSVNLFGAPAFSPREFVSYRQRTIVGASLYAAVPTGQYDPDRLVNIGANRWLVRPELGVSRALGLWTLELAVAASLFGENDEFMGGQTREQDALYSVQGGVIYNFPHGVWAALNGTYYTGGRTTVDGVEGDDLQENSRAGLTVTFPASRRHSVKLFASTGVSTRTGGNYDMVSIAWQYRWGGGL